MNNIPSPNPDRLHGASRKRPRGRLLSAAVAVGGFATLASAVGFIPSATPAVAMSDNLPGGTSVSVGLTTPTQGQVLSWPVSGYASGTASIGSSPDGRTAVFYGLDVSDWTSTWPQDDDCGDPNAAWEESFGLDGYSGVNLDCEISTLIKVNRQAIAAGVGDAALVGFGDVAEIADVGPAAGVQHVTTAGTDANHDGTPDVEEVMESSVVVPFIDNGPAFNTIQQFTTMSLGWSTNLQNVVRQLHDLAAESTADRKIAVIAGSGWSKQGTPFASSADFGAWVNSMLPDVTVYTVAVGVGGFHEGGGLGCDFDDGNGSYRMLALATGGSCYEIRTQEELPNIIDNAFRSQLSAVTVTIDSMALSNVTTSYPLPLAGPATTGWKVPLPANLSPGQHTLCATAIGTDPKQGGAQECATFTVQAVNISGLSWGQLEGSEGAPVALSSTLPSGATPISVAWDIAPNFGTDQGATCVIADPAALATSAVCNDDGVYKAKVKATFTVNGATVSDERSVPLVVANATPTITKVSVTPSNPLPGQLVTVTGSIADSGANDRLSCAFDWSDGTAAEVVNGGQGTCTAARTMTKAGARNLTVTVRDDDGASASASAIVSIPAVALGVTDYTADEGGSASLAPTIGDGVTVKWSATAKSLPAGSAGAVCTFSPNESTPTVSVTCNDDGVWQLAATGTDGATTTTATATLTVGNVAPSLGTIVLTPTLAAVNTTVTATAVVSDATKHDTYTCSMAWDGGAGTTTGTVSNGICTSSRTFTSAGVYQGTMTLVDDDGGTTNLTSDPVVVYDRNGGWVTGNGTITVAAGSSRANPSAAGPARFAFVSKYVKGQSVPSGATQFRFQIGDVSIRSTSYDWMVVSGAKAQYKGKANVNGKSGYAFLLTAVDGDLNGTTDAFRLKVTDNKGAVVFDNQLGQPDSAAPQTISSGKVVISTK